VVFAGHPISTRESTIQHMSTLSCTFTRCDENLADKRPRFTGLLGPSCQLCPAMDLRSAT